MFRKIFFLLKKNDKKYLIGLILYSILISIIEVFGVAVIMPFIAVTTDFNYVFDNEFLSKLYSLLNFENQFSFILFFGFILIVFYIARGILNYRYYYSLSKYSHFKAQKLSEDLFLQFMKLTYKDFSKKNSSDMTKTIAHETSNFTSLISGFLMMFSEFFIVVFIYSLLLYFDYKITLSLTLILMFYSVFMIKTISKKIKEAGVNRERLLKKFYENINRSLNNFKLIKLSLKVDEVFKNFSDDGKSLAKANTMNARLSNYPRLFLETFSFSIIIVITMILVYRFNDDISEIMSLISIFILAFYRIMPSFNRIMNGYNQILFAHKSLDVIYEELNSNFEENGSDFIEFNQNINLIDVSFGYNDSDFVLSNINLKINKGDSIAILGESGSGKSTLIDLIIGVHHPNSGLIKIDSTELSSRNINSWRKRIGYIPQNIYLFDGTIEENISFGNQIDEVKIIDVLKKVNLYDFLKQKDGLKTKVGEGGVLLSGGQKQRIGICRALYNDPQILVLDEATNSLDSLTEKNILKEIRELTVDKTLIIISHNVNALKYCSKAYVVKNREVTVINDEA
jgi:ATP-binding cassette, subfamily B, bacterial PglK